MLQSALGGSVCLGPGEHEEQLVWAVGAAASSAMAIVWNPIPAVVSRVLEEPSKARKKHAPRVRTRQEWEGGSTLINRRF